MSNASKELNSKGVVRSYGARGPALGVRLAVDTDCSLILHAHAGRNVKCFLQGTMWMSGGVGC